MYRPARDHNPSFSSSLLDEIYRSIDQPEESMAYKENITEKQGSFSTNACGFQYPDVERDRNLGRASLIEKWMDKEERSAAGFKRSYNSSSSSSDSSSGGGFSSSEAESVYGVSSRPKPIRTTTNRHYEFNIRDQQRNMYGGQRYQFEDIQLKPKHEGQFVKTKSRAMKIYGDLKKVKQPISPGGRLATFLNSLFTNGKNTKLSNPSAGSYDDGRNYIDGKLKSAGESTCSSASSFSRSCLSKTPSSRGKSSSNKKRSVRFYPVSVIVGDDCQPCGHKSLYGDLESPPHLKFVKHHNKNEFRTHSSDKTRRIEEAARNLLRNYQKKVECEFDLITKNVKNQKEINLNYEEEEDDDDDAASHTSSDLFELENFSAIGMENYGDELPVYETTHLAMSGGFFM